jgi:hypothetical protein
MGNKLSRCQVSAKKIDRQEPILAAALPLSASNRQDFIFRNNGSIPVLLKNGERNKYIHGNRIGYG